MEAYTGGAWRSLSSAFIYVGGQWKRITRAEGYVGGAWKSAAAFLPALTVTIDAPNTMVVTTTGVAISDPITAVPSGGSAPYTYTWSRISGTSGDITSPSAATTTFSAYLSTGASEDATFRCTVTDAFGNQASATVALSFVDVFIPY